MQPIVFFRDPAWRLELRRGAHAALPAAPGVVAWGLVMGVAMVQSGISVPWAIAISLLTYAGSAQLAALPLIAAGQPFWLVALAALVTNLRFVIYNAWFLGTCGLIWVIWQVTSIIGIVAATAVPSEWGLQFAGTLALLALAIPLCLEWPGLAGAAVAAPIAVATRELPLGLGLVAGLIAGIAAAVLVDSMVARRRKATSQPREDQPS
jgi:predicted branched-subunit amino acid permease